MKTKIIKGVKCFNRKQKGYDYVHHLNKVHFTVTLDPNVLLHRPSTAGSAGFGKLTNFNISQEWRLASTEVLGTENFKQGQYLDWPDGLVGGARTVCRGPKLSS